MEGKKRLFYPQITPCLHNSDFVALISRYDRTSSTSRSSSVRLDYSKLSQRRSAYLISRLWQEWQEKWIFPTPDEHTGYFNFRSLSRSTSTTLRTFGHANHNRYQLRSLHS